MVATSCPRCHAAELILGDLGGEFGFAEGGEVDVDALAAKEGLGDGERGIVAQAGFAVEAVGGADAEPVTVVPVGRNSVIGSEAGYGIDGFIIAIDGAVDAAG